MPTYEYLCKKCGHTFEEFQSMSEGALRRCPKCGTDNLARVMGGGGGFILKGSGFYGTDYRRHQPGGGDSGKKEAGTEEPGKKKTGEKEAEKKATEEKAAEKKETESKDAAKKGKEKRRTEKHDGGKGSPGSQPSSPPPTSGPPEKKD
ncbi:MAG TPA: FmdB family zinc ribbon protein [Bacteroidota bacterium]